MLIENRKAIFMLFQMNFSFTLNVHITMELNGTIMMIFSIHSVVSCLSSFTVVQTVQPPITSDSGFNHRFLFNSVLNRINAVVDDRKNSFLKNTETLNSMYHVTIVLFHPLPA